MKIKKEIVIFLVVAIIFIFAVFLFSQNKSQEKTPKSIILGEVEVFVEIADSPDEWERGLMFRESLKENSGMLFIFKDSKERNFWMKNTLVELDIIFINKNFEIVNIKNAIPCEKEPCESYESVLPAKYVLEVNSGFAEKNNLNIGDGLEFGY